MYPFLWGSRLKTFEIVKTRWLILWGPETSFCTPTKIQAIYFAWSKGAIFNMKISTTFGDLKMTKNTSSLKHQLQHGFLLSKGKKGCPKFLQKFLKCPPTSTMNQDWITKPPDLPDSKRSRTINQKPPPVMF